MYDTSKNIIFYNGQFVKANTTRISPYMQGLHYGMGAFEGIRTYSTPDGGVNIFRARAHILRLLSSVEALRLPCSYTAEELINAAHELLERNNMHDAYLRPIVIGGENMWLQPATTTTTAILIWRWQKYFKAQTVRLSISPYRRPSPEAFHVSAKICGHYVNGVLASHEARSRGYDDALQLDQEGNLAQVPAANLFVEFNGKLYTPPQGNIFMGITRQTVIAIARQLGITVVEQHLRPEQLRDADGAFLSGTAVEVVPIAAVDDVTFRLPVQNSIGAMLAVQYRRYVTGQSNISLTYF